MKVLTLEDYQKAGEQFWDKYWYVSKELGEGAKTEDIIKVMETLAGVAVQLKEKEDEENSPFGFNKKSKTEE
tara:strand:- start:1660 stop:1875 length:216 start_codon:yes stop_codon:yes gene_type:complete